MRTEIKERLEEVVTLLNDPDEVVLDKEVKEKLEKVLSLLSDPVKLADEQNALKARMKEIKVLVDEAMIDLEVEVEYCIPDLVSDATSCDMGGEPHILMTYSEDQYTTRTRKVSLGKTALQSSPSDLTLHILQAIEIFKEEADDIRMG
ncbi:MAG: hypothetical protein SPLUMA2_SPLUMAMAG2_01355 [uncultured Sulfurimonas sp.]|nr:MAG: hypothetical protein SPLUMA1_SPLUMAMAG1_01384 [uncultured Sulfurimonas sp.]CAI6166842.1 MAG: hypothetical protein SPLUMA2_SPLUMAMAG2_01355 [uncultured Sulfurimonas sp.]